MRLNLREIIHTPDAEKPFDFALDLSELDLFGQRPIPSPVLAQGYVRNHAGALVLKGVAASTLALVCDRCGEPFAREKSVPLDFLLAEELEDEENSDRIFLLSGDEADLDEVVTTAFVLALDTKNLCSNDCRGLCEKCGANLNRGPCGCGREIDPRLAALAQLLEEE